jgi:uncharacterized protein YndB with AHSA1/START domain
MVDILHEVVIKATPAQVYKAVTEQDGLASWWAKNDAGVPQVGANIKFLFNHGQYVIEMEVEKLEAPSQVHWKAKSGAPDWGGTKVTWDLQPDEQGTKLLFGHRNYASTAGSYASVNYTWGYYLISLKNYLETGKGTPDPN